MMPIEKARPTVGAMGTGKVIRHKEHTPLLALRQPPHVSPAEHAETAT